jgi:hypothetical protein
MVTIVGKAVVNAGIDLRTQKAGALARRAVLAA